MNTDDVIDAALAYEEAWNAYSSLWHDADTSMVKAHAHQALLEAIRAYRREVNK